MTKSVSVRKGVTTECEEESNKRKRDSGSCWSDPHKVAEPLHPGPRHCVSATASARPSWEGQGRDEMKTWLPTLLAAWVVGLYTCTATLPTTLSIQPCVLPVHVTISTLHSACWLINATACTRNPAAPIQNTDTRYVWVQASRQSTMLLYVLGGLAFFLSAEERPAR